MIQSDVVVIGAGVVGLAIARAFARAGRSVIVLERERQFGTGTSSRNSEVIHAGIYYEPGSLKERLCIEGRQRLYAFCADFHVAHRQCGKLIFATSDAERPELEAIFARGTAAGVTDLAWLDPAGVTAIEPEMDCAGGLLSPSTGIIDAHSYMLALLGDAEDHGAILACRTAANRIEQAGERWLVHTDEASIEAPVVINSAGHGARSVARSVDALDARFVPPQYYAKGSYFSYSGRVPFTHLIYPVPVPGGLGTHLTLDLAGQAKFGPNVQWIDAPDYDVDPALKPHFAAAALHIWPRLDPDRLQPGYVGIRPKISGPGEPAADFMIQGASVHGQRGLVNLFGIESPGLTASLAIAEQIVAISDA